MTRSKTPLVGPRPSTRPRRRRALAGAALPVLPALTAAALLAPPGPGGLRAAPPDAPPPASWHATAPAGATADAADDVAADGAADTPMRYEATVSFGLLARRIDVDLDLTLDVAAGQSSLQMLLNHDLAVHALTGEGVGAPTRQPRKDVPGWDQLTIPIAPADGPRRLTLHWRYGGVPLMPGNGINQISPDWVELSVDSAWIPMVASIDRPLVSTLTLDLPENWTIVASGEATPVRDGTGYRLHTPVPHADVAFVAAPDLRTTSSDGFSVSYRRAQDPAAIRAVLRAAARCRDYLDARFGDGDNRLPPGRFVIPDREEAGYARKNYIVLTAIDEKDERDTTRFLCHELAHFWSSGGAPLSVENWLNEAFAVLVAARALRSFYGEATYAELLEDWRLRAAGEGSIWTPQDQSRRSYAVNYKKGPLALHELAARIGEDAFQRVLYRYMTDPVNDTPTLLNVIAQEAGADHAAWFRARLAR